MSRLRTTPLSASGPSCDEQQPATAAAAFDAASDPNAQKKEDDAAFEELVSLASIKDDEHDLISVTPHAVPLKGSSSGSEQDAAKPEEERASTPEEGVGEAIQDEPASRQELAAAAIAEKENDRLQRERLQLERDLKEQEEQSKLLSEKKLRMDRDDDGDMRSLVEGLGLSPQKEAMLMAEYEGRKGELIGHLKTLRDQKLKAAAKKTNQASSDAGAAAAASEEGKVEGAKETAKAKRGKDSKARRGPAPSNLMAKAMRFAKGKRGLVAKKHQAQQQQSDVTPESSARTTARARGRSFGISKRVRSLSVKRRSPPAPSSGAGAPVAEEEAAPAGPAGANAAPKEEAAANAGVAQETVGSVDSLLREMEGELDKVHDAAASNVIDAKSADAIADAVEKTDENEGEDSIGDKQGDANVETAEASASVEEKSVKQETADGRSSPSAVAQSVTSAVSEASKAVSVMSAASRAAITDFVEGFACRQRQDEEPRMNGLVEAFACKQQTEEPPVLKLDTKSNETETSVLQTENDAVPDPISGEEEPASHEAPSEEEEPQASDFAPEHGIELHADFHSVKTGRGSHRIKSAKPRRAEPDGGDAADLLPQKSFATIHLDKKRSMSNRRKAREASAEQDVEPAEDGASATVPLDKKRSMSNRRKAREASSDDGAFAAVPLDKRRWRSNRRKTRAASTVQDVKEKKSSESCADTPAKLQEEVQPKSSEGSEKASATTTNRVRSLSMMFRTRSSTPASTEVPAQLSNPSVTGSTSSEGKGRAVSKSGSSESTRSGKADLERALADLKRKQAIASDKRE